MRNLGILALAATLAGAATVSAQPQDELVEDLAHRARTYREVFDRLSSPDVSQEVLDGLVNQKGYIFEALGDGLELPEALRCAWIKEAVKIWLGPPIGTEEVCFLRQDLSLQERFLYLSIVRQFHKPTEHTGSLFLTPLGGRTAIPPGPFLEALRAHGLVTCEPFLTYDTTLQLPVVEVMNAYCYE
jgi:hypothetical protein